MDKTLFPFSSLFSIYFFSSLLFFLLILLSFSVLYTFHSYIMLVQPPTTVLPPTGRRKSIRPISMEGSMTDTSSLTRNTASSLAKMVIKSPSPSPSPQPLANKSKRRVISRKPSLNSFKVDSKYLQDVSQKRRSSWAPSNGPAIEKKPSLESPELTHSIAPKQQSIEVILMFSR